TFDRAGSDIECDRGCCVEIVARTLIADRWAAVAGSPERDIGFGIVVARNPNGCAAGFPLIAFGPGLTPGFTGRRHGVSAPQFLAGIEVKRRDKAADSVLAT